MPIDPTPKEDDWFRKLQKDFCFPMEWLGKTWLDDKMSVFPDIQRYFLEGAKDEVYHLVREIVQERARLTGVPDAVGRIRTILDRLDEIDPHYRYEFATGKVAAAICPPDVALSVSFGDMKVDVYPKYNGASKDRPITIRFSMFVDSGYESIQNSLNYGLGATIPSHLIENLVVDAPAGLGGSFTGYEIDILPTNTRLDDPVTLALDVMDGDTILSSCPVQLTQRTGGLKGSIFTGTDSTGWLAMKLTVNVADQEFAAEFKLDPKPILPSTLEPLLRWLTVLQPERDLRIRWPEGSEIRSQIRTLSPWDERLGKVIEAFAYLQDHTGIYWEISPSLINEDGEDVVKAATLLKGEKIDLEWESINLNSDEWEPNLEALLKEQTHSFLIVQDMWLKLEVETISIGRVRTLIESARLADPEEVQRALTSGSLTYLRLVPGNSNKAQQFVVPEQH
ncbi:MAG: hypothetical protein OXC95_17655 [Dehalococcoidia bacterium]|nr:hypothetical protein [Dehalococcoidia bacterium]